LGPVRHVLKRVGDIALTEFLLDLRVAAFDGADERFFVTCVSAAYRSELALTHGLASILCGPGLV
jgi:hypothetical protein